MTFDSLSSMRHEPMASAVYLQNTGAVQVEDKRRQRGARETRAFPMNENSGGGES
jgi:hypothetical protein